MRQYERSPEQPPESLESHRPSRGTESTLLHLQATAGNAAVVKALTVYRFPLDAGIDSGTRGGMDAATPSAPAGSPPVLANQVSRPYADVNEIRQDMFVRGNRDWPRLFHFANGRSMPDMLDLWRELAAGGVLAETAGALGSATGVNVPRMRLALRAVQARGHGSRIMFEIDHTTELAALEGGAAQAVLDAVGPENPIVPRLRAAAGFQALTPDEQKRVLVYATGSTSLSTGGAAGIRRVLDNATRAADPNAFRGVLQNQPGLPELAQLPELPPESVAVRQDPPVAVANHQFHGLAANANRVRLHIDDPATATAFNHNQIDVMDPVTRPPARVGTLPSVADVVSMIRRMPRPTRATIAQVNLNPRLNPDDATWARTPGYAGGGFTSDMSAGASGVLQVYPMSGGRTVGSAVETAAHESGHAVSQRLWGDPGQTGTNPPTNAKWQLWFQAIQADGFRASRYTRAALDEDFAEAWLLFTTTRGTPRENEVRTLMPARCRIMDSILASEHTQ